MVYSKINNSVVYTTVYSVFVSILFFCRYQIEKEIEKTKEILNQEYEIIDEKHKEVLLDRENLFNLSSIVRRGCETIPTSKIFHFSSNEKLNKFKFDYSAFNWDYDRVEYFWLYLNKIEMQYILNTDEEINTLEFYCPLNSSMHKSIAFGKG